MRGPVKANPKPKPKPKAKASPKRVPKETGDSWRDEHMAGEQLRPNAFLFIKPGDALIGKIVGYSEGYDSFYRKAAYPIAIVQDEDSDELWSIHMFLPALLSQFSKVKPQVVERVCIRFDGMRENRMGTYEYKDFSVNVQREGLDSVPDFDSYVPKDVEDRQGELPF